MRIAELDAAPREAVVAALRPCLDVDRWIDEVEGGRPYGSIEALLARAEGAAEPLTRDEVARALSHHPRIGATVSGSTTEAAMSRAEQGDADALPDAVARALREGNAAYEERFDRVFLVRAAGRTPQEILAILRSRLENPDGVEDTVVAEQLREIAVLRLRATVSP